MYFTFCIECHRYAQNLSNRIGGVMVSVLVSNVVDHGFESGRVKPKISTGCFSAKHTSLKRKRKDWLARNQDNVSK
jgi:hypothetical protein